MSSTPSPETRTSTSPTPLPTTPPAQPSRSELQALAAVLQAERAAVYGYGVVGGKVGRAQRQQASSRLDWHALNRDAVAAQLSLAGSTPPPGPAAYALPFEVDDEASARSLAVHLEVGVAACYADLVGAAPAARRIDAAQALSACAVAAQRWGAVVGAFPGLPERSEG
ncbi:MAG TPA: DUF4439 domain-containing protein [Actinomycetales bacterium]|nr:DUF4439 domain-containing protein [Actinomycetales bacterium]